MNRMQTHEEMNDWINGWIEEESDPVLLGVLATVDEGGLPSSRTMAIREFKQEGVLFFTQKGSEKVEEMSINPIVSLTLLLFEKKRQVTFRGTAHPLSDEENRRYWQEYPQPAQLRFCVYGPKSGEKVSDPDALDKELAELQKEYGSASPKCPESYVGYRIAPVRLELYQMNASRISDSFIATRRGEEWELVSVVP